MNLDRIIHHPLFLIIIMVIIPFILEMISPNNTFVATINIILYLLIIWRTITWIVESKRIGTPYHKI